MALAVFLWSTSFPFIKWALSETGPGPLVAVRFLVAGLAAVLLFAILRRPMPWFLLKKPWMWVLALSNAAGFALQFFGQELTSAARAALFINTYVIFVAVAAFWFLRERAGLKTWIGVIMGSLGAAVVITGFSSSFLGSGNFIGDLLCVGAALAFTVYILVSKKMIDAGLSALDMSFALMVSTAPLTLIFGLIQPSSFNFTTVWAGSYLGVFCSLVPFILYTYSLRFLSATVSSVMFLGEVVMATVWSFLFLGERFTPAEIFGAMLILFGIFISSTEGQKSESRSRA